MLPIRKGRREDLDAIRSVVRQAYLPYLSSIGCAPGPLRDDYARRVEAGEVWVVDGRDGLDGILVLVRERDTLLLDNIAVADAARGRGIGGALLDHAEATAVAHGLASVRLYTHELMLDNQKLYGRRGYVETHRAEDEGLRRVFMSKRLVAADPGAVDREAQR